MTNAQDAALDLIRNYYATFNAGDREAFLALLTDDVGTTSIRAVSRAGWKPFAFSFSVWIAAIASRWRISWSSPMRMALVERRSSSFAVRI